MWPNYSECLYSLFIHTCLVLTVLTFCNSGSGKPGSDQALTLFETDNSHFGKLGHIFIQRLFKVVCKSKDAELVTQSFQSFTDMFSKGSKTSECDFT